MYWWEVKVSRGERKHLYLTFDNPGIKLFFEESAIKDMNTALQYFNKDSLKEEDSLGKYINHFRLVSLQRARPGFYVKK